MEGFQVEVGYQGALSYVKRDGSTKDPFKGNVPQVTAIFRLPKDESRQAGTAKTEVNYVGLAKLLGDLKQAFVAEAAEQEVIRNEEIATRNYPEVEKNLRKLGQTQWTDAQAVKALAEIAPLAEKALRSCGV